MLLAEKRKRQEVAGKVNHPEYVYRLNGDPREFEDRVNNRGRGDLGPAQPFNRDRQVRPPPFAVDDDDGKGRRGDNNSNNNHREAARGGDDGGRGQPSGNPSNNNDNGNGLSPYNPYQGNGLATPPPPQPYGNGGHPTGPGVYYAPTLPQLAVPTNPLPGPLPSVYRPKPPLIFHPSPGSGGGGGWNPYLHPAPEQQYSPPVQLYPPAAGPTIELSPVKAAGGRPLDDAQRPYTSPSLPQIHQSGGGGGGGGGQPLGGGGGAGGQRRQSLGAMPPIGGGGANIFGDGNGLSEQEEKQRERLAARRRAQELQEENARQMADQERRRAAEKAREAAEALQEEAKLQRERESRARKEQAEVDREERERQAKLVGPKAAQALVAQQEADRKRKEEEALAKRQARTRAREGGNDEDGNNSNNNNNNIANSNTSANATPAAEPAPPTTSPAPPSAAPGTVPQGPPLTSWLPQVPPLTQLPHPQQAMAGYHLAPLPTQPYALYSGGLGGPLPAPLPTTAFPSMTTRTQLNLEGHGAAIGSNAAAFTNAPYTYETENIKRELREISANQRHLEQLLESGALSNVSGIRVSNGLGGLRTNHATGNNNPYTPPAAAYPRAGAAAAPSLLPPSAFLGVDRKGGLQAGPNDSNRPVSPPFPLTGHSQQLAPYGGGGGGGGGAVRYSYAGANNGAGQRTPPRRSLQLEEGVVWKGTPDHVREAEERRVSGSLAQQELLLPFRSLPGSLPLSRPAAEGGNYYSLHNVPATSGAIDELGDGFVDRDLTLSTHFVLASNATSGGATAGLRGEHAATALPPTNTSALADDGTANPADQAPEGELLSSTGGGGDDLVHGGRTATASPARHSHAPPPLPTSATPASTTAAATDMLTAHEVVDKAGVPTAEATPGEEEEEERNRAQPSSHNPDEL